MGYRSQVAFSITVDGRRDKNKFKYVVGVFKLTEFYRLTTAPDYDCINGKELGWSVGHGEIGFYVQDWKWYDGFAVVEAFGEMWRAMQKIEGISGYFIRSGEDFGDVDEDDFGEDPNYDFAHVYKNMEVDTYVLGVTQSEKESDEQVQADTHHCGQDADQEHQGANTAAA